MDRLNTSGPFLHIRRYPEGFLRWLIYFGPAYLLWSVDDFWWNLQVDGGKVVLCFVEFADARCAATALEALQGLFQNHKVLKARRKLDLDETNVGPWFF
jgi:hypothetical protein